MIKLVKSTVNRLSPLLPHYSQEQKYSPYRSKTLPPTYDINVSLISK